MKRIICYFLSFVLVISLAGCGEKVKDSSVDNDIPQKESTITNDNASEETTEEILNLTVLSSTMIYAEVYNMMITPNDYIGKTVKMSGQFAVYEDPNTGAVYFAVIIADATACCSQGIEFVLNGDYNYPDDYPELGAEITVTGVFQTYQENGNLYCHLVDAEMQ